MDARSSRARPTVLDDLGVAPALEDGCRLAVDHGTRGAAQHLRAQLLERVAEPVADELRTGQDGDILQNRLTEPPDPGRAHRRNVEVGVASIHHQRRQRLSFHVVRDHQQPLARPGECSKCRLDGAEARNRAVVDEHEGLLHLHAHAHLVGDESRRQEPLLEMHAGMDLQLGSATRSRLHREEALLPDLLEGPRQQRAELGVSVGRDRRDRRELARRANGPCAPREPGERGRRRPVDTAAHGPRRQAGGDRLHALASHDSSQDDGRRGAVAGAVGSPQCDLPNDSRAHVGDAVLQLDGAGDRAAVARDLRAVAGPLDDHAAPLGTEGRRDGLGRELETLENSQLRLAAVCDLLGTGIAASQGSGHRAVILGAVGISSVALKSIRRKFARPTYWRARAGWPEIAHFRDTPNRTRQRRCLGLRTGRLPCPV